MCVDAFKLVLSDTAVGEQFTAVDVTAHRDFSHFVQHAVAAERAVLISVLMPRGLAHYGPVFHYSLLVPAHQTLMHKMGPSALPDKLLDSQIFVPAESKLSNYREPLG